MLNFPRRNHALLVIKNRLAAECRPCYCEERFNTLCVYLYNYKSSANLNAKQLFFKMFQDSGFLLSGFSPNLLCIPKVIFSLKDNFLLHFNTVNDCALKSRLNTCILCWTCQLKEIINRTFLALKDVSKITFLLPLMVVLNNYC